VRTLKGAVVLALAAGLLAGPARAADPLKIGFITSLSGPAGVIGKHMKDSVELALDHLGRKVGGLETEVVYGDDQRKPDVGKQLADEMLKKHKVNFVSGIIWSNVMLAVAPTVTGAGTIMVGTNAGPHELAGKSFLPGDGARVSAVFQPCYARSRAKSSTLAMRRLSRVLPGQLSSAGWCYARSVCSRRAELPRSKQQWGLDQCAINNAGASPVSPTYVNPTKSQQAMRQSGAMDPR